jgi:hypothetical protein
MLSITFFLEDHALISSFFLEDRALNSNYFLEEITFNSISFKVAKIISAVLNNSFFRDSIFFLR